MIVRSIEQLEDLAPYRDEWNALAVGCVFRSFDWLTTWWRHYGGETPQCSANRGHRKLRVLLVVEGDEQEPDTLLGILPCYSERSLAHGHTWHLLGDGEVCSEHLDLLVAEAHREQVASLLAGWFLGCTADWDTLAFSAVADDRQALTTLVDLLESRGCTIDSQPGPNLWSIALPESWEEFLATQSKSHRKQLRRLENRVLESPRVNWQLVRTRDEFNRCWEIFRELHQRRRISLGEPGCFASERWTNFHHEIARRLLESGNLRLSWLELDGRPVAAEYHFAEVGNSDQSLTSAYQGGLDPDRCNEEPGRLSLIRTIQHAIAEGHTHFDLLRGDEPYKPHWRATSKPTRDLQVISPRMLARWRHRSFRGLHQMGRTVRQMVISSK